jgi:hypothetical protein
MGTEIELEIEYEAPDIETVLKFVTIHTQPAMIPTEQERSQWKIAASGGKLCRKPKWRWYGRCAASSIHLSNGKSWRCGGE